MSVHDRCSIHGRGHLTVDSIVWVFGKAIPLLARGLSCLILVLLLAVGRPMLAETARPEDLATQPTISPALQKVLATASEALPLLTPDERAILSAFYASRAYAPLWTAPSAMLPAGNKLRASLIRIRETGPASIGPLIDATQVTQVTFGPAEGAQLEILLSTALLRSAVDQDDLTTSSQGSAALAAIAAAPDPAAALRAWLPPAPEFWRLRDAITRYRAIEAAGGWTKVPGGPKLSLGAQDDRVAAMKSRLASEGDLMEQGQDPRLFDAPLEAAVRRFQERNGLETDGVVGRQTIEALDVPVRARIRSMLLNLARIHDRPWADERRHVIVNIAGASYQLVDDNQLVFERRIIAGQRDWPTPVLDSVIDRLDLNPYWYVPPRITRLELLPRLSRDPGYLARSKMRLIDGVYRQDPGPRNPLGVVKFLFPNRYSVYLHDTNNPELFERAERFLSHGCVRLSNARELASLLLKDDPTWNDERLEQVIAAGKTQTVTLPSPLPIHIIYQTAWVDGTGQVHFRKDVYGRDR